MVKSRFLTGIITAVLAVFIIYQLYSTLYNPVSTEIVTEYSATDGIGIMGVIIRNENYIKSDSAGTLHFAVSDSERVAAGGTIADIYASSSQSVAAASVDAIDKEIANIEEIQSYNALNAVDLSLINSKIFDNLSDIIVGCSGGNYSEVLGLRSDLLALFNRKQIATGVASGFQEQLDALKAKRAAAVASVGSPTGAIKASMSGYFVSSVDGYETILTPDILNSITPEFLDNLSPKTENTANTVGKIVSDYNWYIAASVSINDSMQFKVGDELTIKTSLKTNPEIKATVYKVNLSPNSDRAVIIFSCNEMSSELSTVRTSGMTVVKQVYSGLKVSSKALRVLNTKQTDKNGVETTVQKTGVYVITGMTAEFVPVDIVYSTSGYVVCKAGNEEGTLRLYDEIVVKGKNLYEGKIID